LCREHNLEDKVEFLGWVKDKESFYFNIDIFCLPSLHEPFGIVLLEAFKYCKPIVSSAAEGPKEIISDGVNGLLTPIGDYVALAKQIEMLNDDWEIAKKIAKGGYQSLKEKYSIDIVGKSIIKLIEMALTA
jgi:glycosyltransferase involved in cell wall biosynthesis